MLCQCEPADLKPSGSGAFCGTFETGLKKKKKREKKKEEKAVTDPSRQKSWAEKDHNHYREYRHRT